MKIIRNAIFNFKVKIICYNKYGGPVDYTYNDGRITHMNLVLDNLNIPIEELM